MTQLRPRPRWAVLVGLGIVAVALFVLQARYPMSYVYRVVVYQDSDASDIHRFPARTIAPAVDAEELPRALDGRAEAALLAHPDIGDLSEFLARTETTAFLIVYRGQLIEERYLEGHDEDCPQNTFSVSKSVTSALIGLAVRDGLLAADDPITRHLPELTDRDPRFADVTVRHLLDMRSGIRYSSRVSFPFVTSDDPLIYYHPDLESVVLTRTAIDAEPGAFLYNNYNPPLLGLALRRATGLAVGEYLERELWQPLGAEGPAGWTTDDRGMERMESGFHARARDLARFGLLYLREGGGVVPEAWVAATTELAEPAELERYDGRRWGYRGGWWIVPRPSGRSDFVAIGRYSQLIYVSRQHEAVFVRTGLGGGEWSDPDWTELFYATAERLSASIGEVSGPSDTPGGAAPSR